MKISRFIISLILISFSCETSVNVDPPNFPLGGSTCLPGQGAIVSETRSLGNFNSIDNFVFADIFITQGPQKDVIIEAQQNILEVLNTVVASDELKLTLDQCANITEPIKVHITIPEIRSLGLTGVGDVIAQNEFNLTDLTVSLTGLGDFDLQGTATTTDITMTGLGDVKAFDLNADVCDINMTGTGDAEVFVNNELNVTMTGTGTVFYKGDPAITSNISGSGSIVDSN
ncbi:MAG: head GIN domain-containing protein [Cyclobacteriaceae bacterium]